MEHFLTTDGIIAFATLTLMEIVLGIDNIVFISIICDKLPEKQRSKARLTGLSLAMGTRVLLLFSLTLIMKLTAPIFTVFSNEISGRDIILISGGLFLIGKSATEIHDKIEGQGHSSNAGAKSFAATIVQILILDLVFSLDSVITAIGMANDLPIMIAAVIVAVIFMMFFSESISNFVNNRPTVKILALGFLVLIGVTLLLEGFDNHINKGYIYFAMAFSLIIEMINQRVRSTKNSH